MKRISDAYRGELAQVKERRLRRVVEGTIASVAIAGGLGMLAGCGGGEDPQPRTDCLAYSMSTASLGSEGYTDRHQVAPASVSDQGIAVLRIYYGVSEKSISNTSGFRNNGVNSSVNDRIRSHRGGVTIQTADRAAMCIEWRDVNNLDKGANIMPNPNAVSAVDDGYDAKPVVYFTKAETGECVAALVPKSESGPAHADDRGEASCSTIPKIDGR